MLIAACAGSQVAPEQIGARDPLPTWDYQHAARFVIDPKPGSCVEDPPDGRATALRLLAWRTFEQGNSWQEEAFWWASYLSADGPRWVLAITLRRNGQQWRFAAALYYGPCDVGRVAYRRFEMPPTTEDAVALLMAAGPTVTPTSPGVSGGFWLQPNIRAGSGWRLREASVRPTAWRATFGADPPDEFQP